MKKLLKKLKSVGYLLAHESEPFRAISERAGENFRQFIVNSQKGKTFVYRTPLGFQFLCLPSLETSANLYVRQQHYEEIELKIAHSWLEEDDSCLDLGANIGYFSVLFATKVSKNGKVIAVEASPQTSKYLQQAITTLALEQICLEPVCVTDRDDFVEFMVGIDNDSDVRQSLKVSSEVEKLFKKEKIPSARLDSLLEKYQIHQDVSLVKMDIEGAEPLALRGGSLLFNENSLPLFIVEVYKLGLQRLGFEPKDIFSYFPSELFELYQINRSYPNPIPEYEYGKIYHLLEPEDYNWPWHTNLIAVPKTGKYSNRKQQIVSYLA